MKNLVAELQHQQLQHQQLLDLVQHQHWNVGACASSLHPSFTNGAVVNGPYCDCKVSNRFECGKLAVEWSKHPTLLNKLKDSDEHSRLGAATFYFSSDADGLHLCRLLMTAPSTPSTNPTSAVVWSGSSISCPLTSQCSAQTGWVGGSRSPAQPVPGYHVQISVSTAFSALSYDIAASSANCFVLA
mmetsp:Transcript_41057/g.88791  ORF Transcript_41057/g.88791 Transcript_41057/m.88791 type:complete len:186 (+) Transcript_41057:223-780(+)